MILVAADLLDVRLMTVLGISLATMAVLSVAIFELAVKGGVTIEMENRHAKTFKGEEYTTVLAVKSTWADRMGSIPATLEVETGQPVEAEQLSEGRMRLRFRGKYAGRTEVEMALGDPLSLTTRRLDDAGRNRFVLDTYPLSLLPRAAPRRLTTFGFGEQPTGYPGHGQELYGVAEYHSTTETKDIIWRRVAKSQDERLTSRVREASVGDDVVRVGVIQFAERTGVARAAWIDSLCEALGQVGNEVSETGAGVTILFDSPGGPGAPRINPMNASEIAELAEAIMSCSVAARSRDIEEVVADSDLLVTGLLELEDEKMATVISEKPLLLISEEASTAPTPGAFTDRVIVWTGSESLFPLIRRTLGR